MPRRVYHPDHTADIRRRLTLMAVSGVVGLAVVAAAGILAMVGGSARDSWGRPGDGGLDRRQVCAAVAVLYLLVTLLAWGLYRRRRAELDAEAAEIVGEFHARIANLRRDDT